jgi:hypothetical protein
MGPLSLAVVFCATTILAQAQSTVAPPTPQTSAPQIDASTKLLPPLRELLLEVERNERTSEILRKNYTYHVHLEEQDLDGKGNPKKTTVTDSESITIEGVRIDRVVAKDGKPLNPDEAKKENERVDKEIAKAKERKQKNEDKGNETTSRGDAVITVSRILELGNFTNPRRVDYNGRPTILADYAGDPNAKTRNAAEGVIRDLVGRVWIDERDRVLVRGEGQFLRDFKIGGGLVLSIHKGFSFTFTTIKINDEVWLPSTVDAQGSARILLFDGVHGRIHLVASDYRKFRTSTTIIPTSATIGADGEIIPNPTASPAPAQPSASVTKPQP